MIKSFADKVTERFYITGTDKKLPSAIQKVARRKLDYLQHAFELEDLRSPPGNRLEALKGDLAGKYSIRINEQYRIVFAFDGHDAYDVQIIDYH
ncbi:MAG: type II toxin-antitoxin system RelE/ParE family toxin [Campylobacterales bacterium]|nr:type II toxin-antitoxin system RelE/ParE family toxin [Campylobacterales bacterium]